MRRAMKEVCAAPVFTFVLENELALVHLQACMWKQESGPQQPKDMCQMGAALI